MSATFKTVEPRSFHHLECARTDAIKLDVRGADEYAEGHIAGFTLLPYTDDDSFRNASRDLPPDSTVFVYCRSGCRSAAASAILSQEGHQVIDLDGGIIAWGKEGLPLTKE